VRATIRTIAIGCLAALALAPLRAGGLRLPGGPNRGGAAAAPRPGGETIDSAAARAFLDTLEVNTFHWFWDFQGRDSVLTPDREPSRTFSSVAAIGFALNAYAIGAERHWVPRAAAARRTLGTLEFLLHAPQDSSVSGSAGYRGFFYHFLEFDRGTRYKDVELSSIDTALLMAGVLFCQSYFDRRDPLETRVRTVAESLYARVDWRWMQARPPAICMGWSPESGFLPYDWRGYDEAMLLQVLALGAPRHAAAGDVWGHWVGGYRWGRFQGRELVGFAPLFGYQYSHAWIDFRGIRDAYMETRGLDYFENSRRATLSQQAYAIENPGGFIGYGAELWGLTACDGPIDSTIVIDGRAREFHTYTARGVSFVRTLDDGTVAPCAAGASICFAPEIVIPTLLALHRDYGTYAFDRHGFVDALNPTLNLPVRVPQGRVIPGVGWFDTDRLGIDQGPLLTMLENWRSALVWRCMRRNPHLIRGLRRAGFHGGWLSAGAGSK
jgi:hypothetical protein